MSELDKTYVDALDPNGQLTGWICPYCTIEVPKSSMYCNVCLFSRPMDRKGIPQIFAGYSIHFNGVIPRTLKHPSHSVEWRMAERHGAVCLVNFDASTVNLLIYRPGYERSDKVRLCVEQHTSIPAVPITWMLDSLLQSRQIHPTLYRLNVVPAVAQPTVRNAKLPHHQHPYYLLNVDEYAIPTSFPPTRATQKRQSVVLATMRPAQVAQIMGESGALPARVEVGELHWTNIGIWQATENALMSKAAAKGNDLESDEDEVETKRPKFGIDIIAAQEKNNKVDKLLFSGAHFLLSESLAPNTQVVKVLRGTGAKVTVANSPSELVELLKTEITHVLYDHGDKKGDIIIQAAQVKKALPGLILVQSNWVEDCLMLGEQIPASGPYVPTAKLMETLDKKYAKR